MQILLLHLLLEFLCHFRHILRKRILREIQEKKTQVDHVYQWKELPEGGDLTVQGYDDLMSSVGVACEPLDEVMAGLQAQVRQRNKNAEKKK